MMRTRSTSKAHGAARMSSDFNLTIQSAVKNISSLNELILQVIGVGNFIAIFCGTILITTAITNYLSLLL